MNKRYRVCMLISSFYPHLGGAESQAHRLARALIERGATVMIVTRRRPGTRPAEQWGGIDIRRVPVLRWKPLRAPSFMISAVLQLIRLRKHFDIIHTHQRASAVTGLIAATLLRKPILTKFPILSDLYQLDRGLRGRMKRWLLRRCVHRYVAISSDIEQRLLALGFDRHRVVRIPNGVDLIQSRSGSDHLPEGIRVLFVGRLARSKGIDVLLRSWEEVSRACPDARLLIAGEGPAAAELRRIAQGLACAGTIFFLGRREDSRGVMDHAQVLVLPSRREGMSNAILEAMERGLPVVASAVGANAELVRDGENGYVVPPGDVGALSRALITVITDSALRKKFGAVSRQRVREHYAIDVVAQRYLELYETLTPP